MSRVALASSSLLFSSWILFMKSWGSKLLRLTLMLVKLTYLDGVNQRHAFAVMTKLLRLDVLEYAHASRALESRIECVRREAPGAEASNLILELFVRVDMLMLVEGCHWVVQTCLMGWLKLLRALDLPIQGVQHHRTSIMHFLPSRWLPSLKVDDVAKRMCRWQLLVGIEVFLHTKVLAKVLVLIHWAIHLYMFAKLLTVSQNSKF